MAPSDKKKRRQSTTFPDLAKKSNVKSETELHDYYLNKNYVPPEKILLETLFEETDATTQSGSSSRRGVTTESGQLVAGKHLAKRYIEDYKFWKQDDKIRNKRRKAKILKQFKGRKKVKIQQSSIEDEQKLIELIQNCPDIDCVCVDQSRYEQSDLGETIDSVYKIILLKSRTFLSNENSENLATDHSSPNNERNEESVTDTPTQHQASQNLPLYNSKVLPDSLMFNNANIYDNSPKKFINNSNNIDDLSLLEDVHSSEKDSLNLVEDVTGEAHLSSYERNEDEKLADTELNQVECAQPDFNPALILQNMKDDAKREEFLKALADDDLMFCHDAQEQRETGGSTSRKINNRVSSRRSVRRSARLMPHHDRIGSVDVEEDVVEKPPKKKTTKKKEAQLKRPDDLSQTAHTQSTLVPKKKRRIKAQIICLQNENDKENVPKMNANVPKLKKRTRKRIPTLKFEMSDSDREDEKEENIKCNPVIQPNQTNTNDSLNLSSKRNSLDISLPNCVRRSLTGEFVPQTQLIRINESLDLEVGNSPAVTRTPLRLLQCPDINIFSPEESFVKEKKSTPDLDKLSVFKQKKKSYEYSSDEEVFISGNVRSKPKPNELLNQRICASSASSVDSQFG